MDAANEKEKVFYETLQKIVDVRAKLERQQADFDQLSLDLQVRPSCSYKILSSCCDTSS